MSQPPRTNRGNRERNRDSREHREESRPRRDLHEGRPPPSNRSASRQSYNSSETTAPRSHRRDVPREEHQESKCSHICSRRGIVLICAVLTNALVLMCVVAAQMVMSGMTAGSFNLNTNINFEGTELQKVRDLDMQYGQMRAPATYGGVAYSLTFGVLTLLFVVSGNKPAYMLSKQVLIGSLVFQGLGAVIYIIAVALYLHFIMTVNATDVCKQRERLYARSGYTWMNCNVGGADAAVALFGLITAILYIVGTVLTFQTVRAVRDYLQEMKRRKAERSQPASHPKRTQRQPDTTVV
ncbi:MARVEL domain-containing protein 3 [Aplochiton taeniatus]